MKDTFRYRSILHIADLCEACKKKTAFRFLVIRWSGMGDVVMTLPALSWLAARFKDCRICYLTDPSFARIVQLSNRVHQVETVDRRGFKSHRGLPPALL